MPRFSSLSWQSLINDHRCVTATTPVQRTSRRALLGMELFKMSFLRVLSCIKMRTGVHKHCNLSGRCPELPTRHRPPVPRWVSRMQQHGPAVRGAAGSTQHCAQRAGLNGMQKAPRREFKLEFGYVWAFPPERGAEKLTADGGRLFSGTLREALGVSEEQ